PRLDLEGDLVEGADPRILLHEAGGLYKHPGPSKAARGKNPSVSSGWVRRIQSTVTRSVLLPISAVAVEGDALGSARLCEIHEESPHVHVVRDSRQVRRDLAVLQAGCHRLPHSPSLVQRAGGPLGHPAGR